MCIINIDSNMQATKNDEIESEVYDEFLAIDLKEQKQLKED